MRGLVSDDDNSNNNNNLMRRAVRETAEMFIADGQGRRSKYNLYISHNRVSPSIRCVLLCNIILLLLLSCYMIIVVRLYI